MIQTVTACPSEYGVICQYNDSIGHLLGYSPTVRHSGIPALTRLTSTCHNHTIADIEGSLMLDYSSSSGHQFAGYDDIRAATVHRGMTLHGSLSACILCTPDQTRSGRDHGACAVSRKAALLTGPRRKSTWTDSVSIISATRTIRRISAWNLDQRSLSLSDRSAGFRG